MMFRLVRSRRAEIRRFGFGLGCFLFCVGQIPPSVGRAATVEKAPHAITLSDAQIRQILVNRIDVQKQGVGIVVGIIEPHKRRVIAYGSLEKGDPRTLESRGRRAG